MKKNKEKRKGIMAKLLIVLLIIITIFILYSRFISTKGLVVKEYSITTDKLPLNFDGLKIVQFSDLHYGSTIFKEELKNIVTEINKQNPDIIVFTGDLVENKVVLSEKKINDIINELKKLNPKIETLAIKGNHDYDHDYWKQITDNLDWHILDNTYEYVYKDGLEPIVFVGLDDYTAGSPNYENAFSYINETNQEIYTIVLAHEPDQVLEFKNYSFNLVLAGHSHLGQVRLPFIGALYSPVGAKKYYDDHYKIDDAHMYINGGLGTSTIKFRFFNKPSINLYRFYTN